MLEKTAPIETLKAFHRSTDEVDSPVIAYPRLEAYAASARVVEAALWREFWETQEDSPEEEERARALARGYLVLTGAQLQETHAKYRPELANRHLPYISERFSEATVELYGQPEAAEVRRLAINQIEELTDLFKNPAVDPDRLIRVLAYLNYQVGYYRPEEAMPDNQDYEALYETIGQALVERFGPALAVFDDVDMTQQFIAPEEMRQRFEQGKAILAKDDPRLG